jgi:hypothetical protein
VFSVRSGLWNQEREQILSLSKCWVGSQVPSCYCVLLIQSSRFKFIKIKFPCFKATKIYFSKFYVDINSEKSAPFPTSLSLSLSLIRLGLHTVTIANTNPPLHPVRERDRECTCETVWCKAKRPAWEFVCRLRLPRDRWAERGSGQKHLIKPLVKYHRHIIRQQRSTGVDVSLSLSVFIQQTYTGLWTQVKNRFPLRCQDHCYRSIVSASSRNSR